MNGQQNEDGGTSVSTSLRVLDVAESRLGLSSDMLEVVRNELPSFFPAKPCQDPPWVMKKGQDKNPNIPDMVECLWWPNHTVPGADSSLHALAYTFRQRKEWWFLATHQSLENEVNDGYALAVAKLLFVKGCIALIAPAFSDSLKKALSRYRILSFTWVRFPDSDRRCFPRIVFRSILNYIFPDSAVDYVRTAVI